MPSEDSDQTGHLHSLIRVFAVPSVTEDQSFLHTDSTLVMHSAIVGFSHVAAGIN